jgi:hypothetical protein
VGSRRSAALQAARRCRPAADDDRPNARAHPERSTPSVIPEPVRKSVRKPVRKPFADLGDKPRPDGGSNCFPLLGCQRGKLIRKSVRKSLSHPVGEPLPNGAAHGGALLGCEHDRAAHYVLGCTHSSPFSIKEDQSVLTDRLGFQGFVKANPFMGNP